MHVIQSVPVSGCDHLKARDLAAISTASRIAAGVFSTEINFHKGFLFHQEKEQISQS